MLHTVIKFWRRRKAKKTLQRRFYGEPATFACLLISLVPILMVESEVVVEISLLIESEIFIG